MHVKSGNSIASAHHFSDQHHGVLHFTLQRFDVSLFGSSFWLMLIAETDQERVKLRKNQANQKADMLVIFRR